MHKLQSLLTSTMDVNREDTISRLKSQVIELCVYYDGPDTIQDLETVIENYQRMISLWRDEFTAMPLSKLKEKIVYIDFRFALTVGNLNSSDVLKSKKPEKYIEYLVQCEIALYRTKQWAIRNKKEHELHDKKIREMDDQRQIRKEDKIYRKKEIAKLDDLVKTLRSKPGKTREEYEDLIKLLDRKIKYMKR